MVSEAYESAFARTRRQRAVVAISNSFASDALRTTRKLVTNAGILRAAYFQNTAGSGQNLWTLLGTASQGNAPSTVNEASNLWSTSLPYKGMIASYKFPGRASSDDSSAASTNPAETVENLVRYGFQFHYNPTTVDMTYSGVPEIDIGMYTSGTEKFNDLGANVMGSTITFTLVLNRIADMQAFDSRTGLLKEDVRSVAANFAGRKPDVREQKDIYNKGTMYDVEFLLRTIVGVRIQSLLGRNMGWDNKTADIGFLTGKPVELHLGKSLRYLGRVENIALRHIMFNERMVPIFTEMSITFTRIPDYTSQYLNNLNGVPTASASTYAWIPGVQGGVYADVSANPSLANNYSGTGRLYGDLDFSDSIFGGG